MQAQFERGIVMGWLLTLLTLLCISCTAAPEQGSGEPSNGADTEPELQFSSPEPVTSFEFVRQTSPLPFVGQCKPSEGEQRMARAMREHPNQARPFLLCNRFLEELARERAARMADSGGFSHRDEQGMGPNSYLMRAGFPVATFYPGGASNFVESLARSGESPEVLVDKLAQSIDHRDHIMGTRKLNKDQFFYGIGHARTDNGPFPDYWVILITQTAGGKERYSHCTRGPISMCLK